MATKFDIILNKLREDDGTWPLPLDPTSNATVTQIAHWFSALQPVYHNGVSRELARADAEATLATHIITEVLSVDSFVIAQSGVYTITWHGLTVGAYQFTDVAVAWSLVDAEPTTWYSNPVAYVQDANTIRALNWRAYVAWALAPSINWADEGVTVNAWLVQIEIDNMTRTTANTVWNVIASTDMLAMTEWADLDYKATAQDVSNFVSWDIIAKFRREQWGFAVNQVTITLANTPANPAGFFTLYVNSQQSTYWIDYTVAWNTVTMTWASYPIEATDLWELNYIVA